jgi:hypothetical protein
MQRMRVDATTSKDSSVGVFGVLRVLLFVLVHQAHCWVMRALVHVHGGCDIA